MYGRRVAGLAGYERMHQGPERDAPRYIHTPILSDPERCRRRAYGFVRPPAEHLRECLLLEYVPMRDGRDHLGAERGERQQFSGAGLLRAGGASHPDIERRRAALGEYVSLHQYGQRRYSIRTGGWRFARASRGGSFFPGARLFFAGADVWRRS